MTRDVNHKLSSSLPKALYGIGASPGVVIGRVLQIDHQVKTNKHVYLDEDRVQLEIDRFQAAVDAVEKQLDAVRGQFAEHLQTHLTIIDTHKIILRDRMLYEQTIASITNEAINAEWALEKSLDKVKELFESIQDTYFRERFQDIEQVVQRLYVALSGGAPDTLVDVGEKVIAVSRDFSPEDTLRMKHEHILGIVTETGGTTSHTAIIARALGIPSVVGVENINEKVATGDLLIIDGSSGRVLLHPTTDQLEQYKQLQNQQRRYSEKIKFYADLPPETVDGAGINVLANIEMLDETDAALEYGATGIGLFRSEYYYISKKKIPEEEALFELYRSLLKAMVPHPVTIRTLDIGGDKISTSVIFPHEINPAMGLRAIRYCLREPKVFETQLRALLRASVHGNLRIMFPMISSLCEVQRVKEFFLRVKDQLYKDGLPFNENVQIGIMIEVPSAVSIADVLAREVDFFSIGTNDLIQYALAIDRVNEYVAHMYEPLCPAVLRMIKQAVDAGHEAGIEVGMCGEMAGEIMYLPLLLGFGLDELSMHPFAIPYIKRMVRKSSIDVVEKMSTEVLHCTSTKKVKELLADQLSQWYPDDVDILKLRERQRSC